MNTCRDCRWCQITDSEITGVSHYNCRKVYNFNYVTGARMPVTCNTVRGDSIDCYKWERGGLVGLIRRIFRTK